MAFQAIDFLLGSRFFVLKVFNVSMAVDACKPFVVFNEETTLWVMYLWDIQVTEECAVGVIMAIVAGLVIAQIFSDNRCSKAKSQQ